jgi:putative NIF3 family GTP cyclohydrolase 1 type 2
MLRRREFLAVVSAAMAGPGMAQPSPASGPASEPAGGWTVGAVIDRILKEIPGPAPGETVDTLKAGSRDQLVKGIATTFMATCDVIERAAAGGANLIITHEPTFYNHRDQTDWLAEDPVYRRKVALLEEKGMAIWRFHDFWHRWRPDPMNHGLIQDFGWTGTAVNDTEGLCRIPEIPLGILAARLRDRLGLRYVRVVGRLEQPCSLIGLLPGAWGGGPQIGFLREHNPDVLVVGEISEWETNVYLVDANWAGMARGLIILGHVNTEEPGMRFLAEWLGPRFPHLNIRHVPMTDPFHYL